MQKISTSLIIGLMGLFLLSACKTLKMNNIKTPEIIDSNIIEMETTLGTIKLELFDNTPGHRDNFKKLVKQGFYDSLLFHRVIPEFMIQGGDPDSKDAKPGVQLGMGGPGYTIPAELTKTDTSLANVHIKGMLAAARMGDQMNPQKASSGSQFYIVEGKKVDENLLNQVESVRQFKYSEEQRSAYKEFGGTPHLDAEYTVFGKIIGGLDVIEKIAVVACDRGNRPTEDVRIISAKMVKE
jgi:cyclophilin family peptidyl-prolyl cis-trans isomerase